MLGKLKNYLLPEGEDIPTTCCYLITYKCNGRCTMCNVWKKYEENPQLVEQELDKETFINFVESNESLRNFVLNGGEPFLREEFLRDIVQYLLEKNKTVGVVTNGLLTDKIINFVEDISQLGYPFGMHVSLDGINEIHDKVRGVKNAYNKTLNTLKKLVELKTKYPHLGLSVGFVVTPINYMDLYAVYRLARNFRVGFDIGFALESEHHLGNKECDLDLNREILKKLEIQIDKILEDNINDTIASGKYWLYSKQNLHFRELLDYEKGKIKKRKCNALKTLFLLDPYGDVYPCSFLNKKLGNIRIDSLKTIWQNQKVKAYIRNSCNCNSNIFWRDYTFYFNLRAFLVGFRLLFSQKYRKWGR